jgi:hypothetical protein
MGWCVCVCVGGGTKENTGRGPSVDPQSLELAPGTCSSPSRASVPLLFKCGTTAVQLAAP